MSEIIKAIRDIERTCIVSEVGDGCIDEFVDTDKFYNRVKGLLTIDLTEPGEWKIDSVDRYYYQSGRNYTTYKEVTYWYEIHTLERKETVRSETINDGSVHQLPEWARGITTRNRLLEIN